MNDKKTDNYRYYISYLLDDLPVGAEFNRSVLHITVLPWFTLQTDEAPFIDWFYQQFGGLKAFDAVAVSRAMFGPQKDVPVSILEPKDKFMKLHQLALSWFGELGADWAERDPYVGDDYKPHIAQRHGYVIDDNETIHIGSLTLFKAAEQEYQTRTVSAKAVFNEPA